MALSASFLGLFAFLSAFSFQAQAAPGDTKAHLQGVFRGGRVTGLGFEKGFILDIRKASRTDADPSPYVLIQGRYSHPGWNLLYGRTAVRTAADGRFVIRVPLHGHDTPLVLYGVGPKGEVETARFNIVDPSATLAMRAPGPPKRLFVVPGFGYSFLSYHETGVPDFSESGITGKLSINYVVTPGKFTIGVTGFGTALPLGSNQPGTSVRFIGANLRLGWTLPVKAPWSVTLMTGGYYTTMLVQNGNFGFADLMGPQAFVLVSHSLSPRYSIGGYGKFAMMGSGFSLAGPQDREIAAGLSFTRILGGGQPLSLTVDVSDLQLSVDTTSLGCNSFSVGMSLGF